MEAGQMQRKTIAVCIISYNQRDYLIEAIESVLAQTRRPDQIIVIDDVSPDDSVEVLRQYERDHPGLFTIVVNEINQGNGTNRHLGVLQSNCDLITYLDGDDLYYPDKLKLEEQCLIDNPEAGFVYSDLNLIDTEGNTIRPWTTNKQDIPTGDVFESVIGFEFPGGIQCRFPLTNTESLIEATKHAQGFSLYEDLVIMMYLSRFMKSAFVDSVNVGYRLHDAGVHRTHHEGHSNVLDKIYRQNKHLFESLAPEPRKRIEKKFHRILCLYAWRGVRDHARRPSKLSRGRAKVLAKRAMRHDPLALRPKHVMRVLSTQLKSPKFPPAKISN